MTAVNFGAKTSAVEVVKGLNAKLDGKVIVVTGAISGIGIETARALASTHAHVIITARDMNKGNQVVEDIKKTTGNNKVEVMELDLTSLKSVRNFVAQFRSRKLPINILICNAGIMACPYSKTIDGFESQFAICIANKPYDLTVLKGQRITTNSLDKENENEIGMKKKE